MANGIKRKDGMLNNDSSHDEKWKNKKPSLDCFGLTQEVIDNNHIAHEQKANYDKKWPSCQVKQMLEYVL